MWMDVHKTLHRTQKSYSTCHDKVVGQFALQMVIKKQTLSSKERLRRCWCLGCFLRCLLLWNIIPRLKLDIVFPIWREKLLESFFMGGVDTAHASWRAWIMAGLRKRSPRSYHMPQRGTVEDYDVSWTIPEGLVSSGKYKRLHMKRMQTSSLSWGR